MSIASGGLIRPQGQKWGHQEWGSQGNTTGYQFGALRDYPPPVRPDCRNLILSKPDFLNPWWTRLIHYCCHCFQRESNSSVDSGDSIQTFKCSLWFSLTLSSIQSKNNQACKKREKKTPQELLRDQEGKKPDNRFRLSREPNNWSYKTWYAL